MSRHTRVDLMGLPCELCALRTDSAYATPNTATRNWYGSTEGEYVPADPVYGVACCTTCYYRVQKRAKRQAERTKEYAA